MRTEEQTINIIFDAGKGTSPVLSRESTVGAPIGSLPVPTRSGFSFEGWFLDEMPVDATTVVESDEDIRLVAHWKKKTGVKRNSVLKRQKIAIVCMIVLIAMLSVSLVFVNDLISVTTIEDVYYNENGERLTQTYYIKKVNDIYSMYDKDNVRMQVNDQGYHIAMSGNQYDIDKETGKCTLYAMVDAYDASIGELLDFDARVMMFEEISQDDIYSIKVTNKDESFTILRHSNGSAYIKGTEGKINALSDNIFANLAVSCGYTLTIGKLDLNKAEAPKNEDGSVNYGAYGLAPENDPIVYTITKRAYNEDGTTCAATGPKSSYTVYVGDATLSDTGYYARLEGREAVYILSPMVTPTLTRPVEAMVTPTAIYPMNVATHVMVYDFLLEEVNMSSANALTFLQGGYLNANTKNHIVDFSYRDILDRDDTMFALHPYETTTSMMEGYFLDSNNISNALTLLYQMKPTECVQLGLTEESIRKYIFDDAETANVFHLSFRYNVVEREAILKKLSHESNSAFKARCHDKAISLLKGYGVSNVNENESTDTLLTMLEQFGVYLEDGILYDKLTHFQNVYAYCSGMLIDLGYTPDVLNSTQNTDIDLLQTKVNELVQQLKDLGTGVQFDKTTMDAYVVNEVLISQKSNGVYYLASTLYDMIVVADAYSCAFLEWNSKNWYSQYVTWVELPFVTDIQVIGNGKEFNFTLDNSKTDQSEGPNTKDLEIYYESNGNKILLDYGAGIEKTYITDTGKLTTEYVNALTNFREFYQIFEYVSLNGIIDAEELEKMDQVGLSPSICQGLPDSECDLLLYYRAVDPAGNSVAKIVRFYTYSGHAYVTVEVVDAFDENGNYTNDWRSQTKAENAKGMFYADAKYIAKILADAERVVNKELVDTSSKT